MTKIRPIYISVIFFSVIFLSESLFSLEIGQNPLFSKRYKEALINNVVFSPDGKTIATTEAKKVQIWDAKSGKLLFTVYTYKRKPFQLAYSGSGNLLITGGYGGRRGSRVKVWDISKKKLVFNLVMVSEAMSVAISPDDSIAAIAGVLKGDKRKASITLWDLRTGKKIVTLKKKSTAHYYPQSLQFSKDGNTLINSVSNKERGIEIWDLKTNKLKKYIKTKLDVTPISLSPDEKILVAGLLISETRRRKPGGIIRVFAYPSMRKLYNFKGLKGFVTSLSFHPGGRHFASGIFSSRPNFIVWDLKTRKSRFRNKKGSRPVMNLAFSPDGKSLAVVLNTYGNLGNPDTLQMLVTGTKEELKKSGASNDMNTFRVGQSVKAKINGRDYTGVINKKSKHHYLLKMDNRRPKYWLWVEPGSLRPK